MARYQEDHGMWIVKQKVLPAYAGLWLLAIILVWWGSR